MSREWKPGDVAMTSKNTVALCHLGGRMIDQNGAPWSDDRFPDNLRPLVVIDPEDAEQVNRLADAFCAARWSHMPGSDECDPLTRSAMREALSEYLRPTPPRPDEPQGLGAVVEDAKGLNWIRIHPGGPAWVNGYQRWAEWSEVDAVRVVSPGVTS